MSKSVTLSTRYPIPLTIFKMADYRVTFVTSLVTRRVISLISDSGHRWTNLVEFLRIHCSYCLLERRSYYAMVLWVSNTFHRIPNTPHDFQNGGLSCDSKIILFKDPVLPIMHCALRKSAAIFLMLKNPVDHIALCTESVCIGHVSR